MTSVFRGNKGQSTKPKQTIARNELLGNCRIISSLKVLIIIKYHSVKYYRRHRAREFKRLSRAEISDSIGLFAMI